jgi:hypothetical protein
MFDRSKALAGAVAVVCVSLGSGCVAGPAEEQASTSSNVVAADAPEMIHPQAGQAVGLSGSYMFKVRPAAGSTGTLCSLWQDGRSIWENYANDGVLGQNGECAIHPDNPLHARFHSGAARFLARDLVDGAWTTPREIDINLTIGKPSMVYPQNGQTVGLGGNYMFKMGDAKGTQGALCSIWQNGQAIWENWSNDRTLGQNGECALGADNARHGAVTAGPAKFLGRFLVHGEWSEAVEIDVDIR